MPIQFRCVCERRIQAPSRFADQFIECPHCEVMVKVPTETYIRPRKSTESNSNVVSPVADQLGPEIYPVAEASIEPAPLQNFAPAPTAAYVPHVNSAKNEKSLMPVLIAVSTVSVVTLMFVIGFGVLFLMRQDKPKTTVVQQAVTPPVAQATKQTTEPPSEEVATEEPAPQKTFDSESRELSNPAVASNGTQLQLADLIELVEPSVVQIKLKGREGESIGSGFFVDRDGTIVTNFHVVQGANTAQVIARDQSSAPAEGFLVADPDRDLAVIKVDPKYFKKIVPIALATTLPRKGESVAAFGSPLGFSFSATEGIVSSTRTGREISDTLKELSGADIYKALGFSTRTNWIQTSAAISGGNSGGPLVNMKGEMVGVNTWTVPLGQNLNFASRTDEVRAILAKANGNPRSFRSLPRKKIQISFDPGGGPSIQFPPGFDLPPGIELPPGFGPPPGIDFPGRQRPNSRRRGGSRDSKFGPLGM